MSEMRRQNTAPKKKFEPVIVKEVEEGGQKIQLLKFGSHYRLKGWHLGKDKEGQDRWYPDLEPKRKFENGVVSFEKIGGMIGRLIDGAILVGEEKEQHFLDRHLEIRQQQEMKEMARLQGTNEVERTGKTQREVAKRARHQQNLITRRAQDQERTSNSKAGRTK